MLKEIFSKDRGLQERGISFEFSGAYRSFPYYKYDEISGVFEPIFVEMHDKLIRLEKEGVLYLDREPPCYDIRSSDFRIEPVDFICAAKEFHHCFLPGEEFSERPLAQRVRQGKVEQNIVLRNAKGDVIDMPRYYCSETQQRAVENLLGSLKYGGYLFFDVSMAGISAAPLYSKNDDVFIIMRRINANEFQLYDQVIAYDTEVDRVFPKSEVLLQGNNGARLSNKGIKEVYKLAEHEFLELQGLIRQADALVYYYQCRDFTPWFMLEKATHAINEGRSLRTVFEVYFEGVRKILESQEFVVKNRQEVISIMTGILEKVEEIEKRMESGKLVFPLEQGEEDFLRNVLHMPEDQIDVLRPLDVQLTPEQLQDLQTIISFLAQRDIDELSCEQLQRKYGVEQADLLILLGNSSLYIAEQAAEAIKKGLARNIMIAGGIGHSTGFLRRNIAKYPSYRDIDTEKKSEAEILQQVLIRNGVDEEIILETESTNCGANAIKALSVLEQRQINPNTVILMQDPSMQKRTWASFEREWNEKRDKNVRFINYAAFIPNVRLESSKRFISLVMGEMPRFEQYGPNGKGFICHVQIPADVLEAYARLSSVLELLNREQKSEFATNKAV